MPGLLPRVRRLQPPAPLPHLRQRRLLLLLLLHHQQGTVLLPPRSACDKCSYHYSDSEREIFKAETLKLLTSLCVEFLAVKLQAEEQLKGLELEVPREEGTKEKRGGDEKTKKQNERLEQLGRERKRLEEEIERIKNS